MTLPGSPRRLAAGPRRPHRGPTRPYAAVFLVASCLAAPVAAQPATPSGPNAGPQPASSDIEKNRGNDATNAAFDEGPENVEPDAAETRSAPESARPASPRRTTEEEPFVPPSDAPTDPDDNPFMDPPNGQPAVRGIATTPDLVPRHSLRRRVQLTAVPLYAALRLPMLGRPTAALHGAGALLSADVQVWSWIYLRLYGGHSAHPVDEFEQLDEEEVELQRLANRGAVQATTFGGAAVIALDIGRFLPLIDIGMGGLRMSYPEGAIPGQQGMPCADEGLCDVGLRCSAQAICEPSVIGDLQAGVGVDVLLREHLTVGGEVRYHALLSAPGTFPIYLTFGMRLGVRW